MKRALVTVVVLVLLLVGAGAGCSDQHRPDAVGSSTSSSEAPQRLEVLVTNDDGVGAPGIDTLVRTLLTNPHVRVTVVAPAQNQSGSGGKTTGGPVTAKDTTTTSGYPAVAVDGYPTDAVDYALRTVYTSPPDVVISGVNAGQNIGPFIDLSGTVGAARAGARAGIPALAVSAGFPEPYDFIIAAQDAEQWVQDHLAELSNEHPAPVTVDNLNVPTCTSGKVRGLVVTTADLSAPTATALQPADCTSTLAAPSTDVAAFDAGFATLSFIPLEPANPSG